MTEIPDRRKNPARKKPESAGEAGGWRASMQGIAMNGPQVLIAEDEGMLRTLIVEMLTERGLCVMQAEDGLQASQMLKDNDGITVLLSDVRMPRMDGYALVENALAHNPALKVLMMSGFAGDPLPLAALKARDINTLIKPFNMDDMCEEVIAMLERP